MENKPTVSKAQAWAKAQRYCAYQERCHAEVKDKLYSFGIAMSDVEEITSKLIEEGFLNEERFAKAYAGGKFRVKKWGKVKILYGLKAKGISAYCIKQGMNEIDDVLYYEQLKSLVYKRWDEMKKEKHPLLRKNKTGSYLIAKGYEPDLVWDILKTLS